MDATGVVLRQPLRFPSSSYSAAPASAESKISSASIVVGRRKSAPSLILSSGFCDQGHVKYYNSNFAPSSSTAAMMSAISGKKEKSRDDKASKKMKTKKKQLKLLKGIFRDFSTFSRIGFGLDSDRNMISEVSEILLNQLRKLKAEEKEMKRKLKEEKARLKAEQNMSSSSSSDSECGETVDINNLKNNLQQVIEDAATTQAYQIPTSPSSVSNVLDERRSSSCNADKRGNVLTKIEVCMGGKCKKSGAGALLEEFQKVVGVEGSVSGCKCMGKCRDGPNVKVLTDKCVDEAPTKSMCVGVGLEDVNVIVAKLLGQKNDNQVGFVASSC